LGDLFGRGCVSRQVESVREKSVLICFHEAFECAVNVLRESYRDFTLRPLVDAGGAAGRVFASRQNVHVAS